MQDDDEKRAKLVADIAQSRRVRHYAIVIAVVGVVLAIGLLVMDANGKVILGVALGAVMVGGAGAWITGGHIQDFKYQLRALDERTSRGSSV